MVMSLMSILEDMMDSYEDIVMRKLAINFAGKKRFMPMLLGTKAVKINRLDWDYRE